MGKIQMIWRLIQSPRFSRAKISFCLSLLALLQYTERIALESDARSYMSKTGVSQDLACLSTAISLKLCLSLLTFVSSMLGFRLISFYYRSASREILNCYLNLKYQSFRKFRLGAVQCMVFRRSSAITELISIALTRFFPRLFLLILSINALKDQFGLKLSIKIALLLAIYFIFIVTIQKKRSDMRKNINYQYEASNTKRLDILINYERVIAYGNLEKELDLYSEPLEKYTWLKQIYEVTYDTIGLMSSLYLFYISYYAIREISGNAQIHSQEYAFVIIMIENVRKAFYEILRDIDAVFISYSNLENSQIDQMDFEPDEKPGIAMEHFRENIVFEDVSVNLGSNKLLDKINLSIEKNKKIAIIGENGAGKSVFIRTLAGLLEYQGSIKIDGIEARSLGLKTINHLISYLPQSISMFNSTILDNLKAGCDSISEEKLIDVCKIFDCHDIFKELGYSKPVGEGGKYLSGGQRQKIALLRAIIRNSQILVLDGAFNGLDQISEQSFTKTIVKYLYDRTIICVVQNLNLLSYFDQIMFFRGNEVEFGTYQGLYEKSASFRRFADLKNL